MRAGPVQGVSFYIDHTMSSSVFADDKNTIYVNGWGKADPKTAITGVGLGVTNARISWEGRSGGAWIRPFIGVNNLWDRTYVSALTLNGAFGRVFETAPGRNWYIGGEIGWAAEVVAAPEAVLADTPPPTIGNTPRPFGVSRYS